MAGGVATAVRDTLGLINVGAHTYLVSLRFETRSIQGLTGLKMARPVFADLGNSRFAIYLNKSAESAYADHWGLTVNLARLCKVPRAPINGVPERITSPIPLEIIGSSIGVAPLGWTIGARGDKLGMDDDDTFVERLRGRRRLASMKTQLLRLADTP
jgi:hypothetical protein